MWLGSSAPIRVCRRGLLFCCLALAAFLVHAQKALCPAQDKTPAKAEPAERDPLVALNNSFRVAYAAARKQALMHKGPVVFVMGDYFTLLRNGKRSEAKVIPELYNELKAVAHVPLASFVMLEPFGEVEISADRLDALGKYCAQLELARKSLGKRGLTAAVWQRQEQIFAQSAVFLDDVLKSKKCKNQELSAFARKMAAGARQCRRCRQGPPRCAAAAVEDLAAEMTAEEWQTLRVLMQSSHMPRKSTRSAP